MNLYNILNFHFPIKMNKLLLLLFLFTFPLNTNAQTWQRTVKFVDSQGLLIKEYHSIVTNVQFIIYSETTNCQIIYNDTPKHLNHTPLISYNPEINKSGWHCYHWNGQMTKSMLKLKFNTVGDIMVAEYKETYRGDSSKIILFRKIVNDTK